MTDAATLLSYDNSPYPVREGIEAAHKRTWRRIAEPGTWLEGPTRIAIAAETRNAPGCQLCEERKFALSPYTVDGNHDSLGHLPEVMVEMIHRIVSDPGRLTESWLASLYEAGMEDTEYVETLGVISNVMSVDTFARALGIQRPELPEPVAGEPSRRRPAEAKIGPGWVPTIAPKDASPENADIYALARANVRQGMSLVPDEVRGFFDLANEQYLNGTQIADLEGDFRSISRLQIELLATRVSALNGCFF